MIVRQDGDRLILILQTDHAAISGWLAEHWGNDAFDRPDPFDSVVYAAARHDDGWIPWEKAPKVDPETRLPYQFTDLPIDEHWGFYSTGLAELAVFVGPPRPDRAGLPQPPTSTANRAVWGRPECRRSGYPCLPRRQR